MGEASRPSQPSHSGISFSSSNISRIAIIGAGPIGVSCAKYLIAERAFKTIEIYEQRDRVGGIWNLSDPTRSKRIPVPQEDPRYGHHLIEASTSNADGGASNAMTVEDDEDEELEFESPLYDYLETNIPKHLMAFSDKPFPESDPLFPSHQAVLRYLEEYAGDVKQLIRFKTAVRDVRAVVDEKTGQERWTLSVEDLVTKQMSSGTYDAVIVANGHYTIPYLPDIQGIREWNVAYPGRIIHSKAYRKPEDFKDLKVVVVGNSASGLDIATQIGMCCRKPVLLSSRSASIFGAPPADGVCENVDEIVEFLAPRDETQRAIRFRSGRVEKDIDRVVFATGYFYSYPFLANVSPPIVTDGLRARGTYQHLFSIAHPTLAFPVINLKVIPFPMSQNQAAVIARVWSGRLDLPSVKEMEAWESQLIQMNGSGKYFHLKKFPGDAAQINELYDWAQEAGRREGLEGDGVGKLGTRWNERDVWMRSRFPDIKGAFLEKGEDRIGVTTIEELGFDFDQWRRRAEDKDLQMFKEAKCL